MVLALGLAALVVGAAGLDAHVVAVPGRIGAVLAAGSPYAMLAAPVALTLLAVDRRWVPAGLAAVVTIAAAVTQAPRWTRSGPGPQPSGGIRLRVLQANLLIGRADPAAVVARVRDGEIDVVAIEELTAGAIDGLHAAGLDTLLPHRFVRPHPGGGGSGIWSRFPLHDQRTHDGYTMEMLSAVPDVPGAAATTVYALHLLPPFPYPAGTWNRELGRLAPLLAGDGGPIVAAGDLNATGDHRQFRRLLRAGRVRDAADVAGRGRFATWPTDRRAVPPLLALDHVLVRGVSVDSIRTVPLPGSDHRGLVVDVRLPPMGQ